ncbi:uncharacterized protein BCR38DRAFT_434937 [Pseudomassariella vexata]|uniref:Uncharacterized protein n=1 Tax=Pseudomassariella vexata TaxID=1141098 RepID=A0A1Y2DYL5_9PEZI|nr:uncharacterized protein BCR38DRAFT_434937 [Pseudomassariella vexata]ORY64382.1 hypothetical protein BCR38DRAFT_434937 [Pseudomassariella vexata]
MWYCIGCSHEVHDARRPWVVLESNRVVLRTLSMGAGGGGESARSFAPSKLSYGSWQCQKSGFCGVLGPNIYTKNGLGTTMKSRLLHFHFFFIGLVAIEAFAYNNVVGGVDAVSPRIGDSINFGASVWKQVIEHVVVERENERENEPRRVILERIPEVTPSSANGQWANIEPPRPTPPPQKRQDNGQIQALSGRIQELSGTIAALSLTLSAVSSASQSLKQSADQAIRIATENENQANQALTRAQTSAASALAQATQQFNDQLGRASASFSSQLSASLSSAQASASSAIGAVQSAARESAVNAMNVAASQIQEVRLEASGVRGDANNFVAQIQRNSVSATNVAIIIVVTVVVTIILTIVASWLFIRYRRKRRKNREVIEITDDKAYLVRGISGHSNQNRYTRDSGARFNPYGGGTGYPMDKMELPSVGKPVQPEPLNFGFAVSDYNSSDKDAGSRSGRGQVPDSFQLQRPPDTTRADAVRDSGMSTTTPTNLRFQRPPSIKNAAQVRLIRVNSGKNRINEIPAPPPSQPLPDVPSLHPEPPKYEARSERYTMTSEANQGNGWQPPTQATIGNPNPITTNQERYSVASEVSEASNGWQPARSGWEKPKRRSQSLGPPSTRKSLVAEIVNPEIVNPEPVRPRVTATKSAQTPPKAPKASANFSTFPTVRSRPPSTLNHLQPSRGLDGMANVLRGDPAMSSTRSSREIFGG